MKGRGFTLIELLAVIVILAIIALIAVPIVLNIIGDSKEESNKASIEMYGRAIQNAISNYKLDNPAEKNIKPYMLYKSWNGRKDYIQYNGDVECDIEIYESSIVYLFNCKVNGIAVDYTYGTKGAENNSSDDNSSNENDSKLTGEEVNMNAYIGEVVNYVSGTEWENQGYHRWIILGEENGQIKLISNYVVTDTPGVDPAAHPSITLSGKIDYETAVARLNSICQQYGKGLGADYARSFSVDDINQVIGYNPTKTADGLPANSGNINEYGNVVTYTMKNGILNYVAKNGAIDTAQAGTIYYKPDGTELAEGESITVRSDWYFYDPTTLYTPQVGNYSYGIKTDSKAYKVLFDHGFPNIWLADQAISTKGNFTTYGIRSINYSNGYQVQMVPLYRSNGETLSGQKHIRAVVYLDANAKLVKQEDGTWNIEI